MEEDLIADYADGSDLIGHKKAQKTSAFVPIPLGLRTDRQRKIGRRLPKLTESERLKTDDGRQRTEGMNWVPDKRVLGSALRFEKLGDFAGRIGKQK